VSESLPFSAEVNEAGVPALSCHWDFGDGTTADGLQAAHAYTRDADFTVRLTAEGLDGVAAHQTFTVKVTGTLTAPGDVLQNRRYTEPVGH
jgi:PKD repeat protein